LWWWFWVFEFSLWKKKSPEFCTIVVIVVVVLVFEFFTVEEKNSRILHYCCCGGGGGGGVFGFSIFTIVRGFFFPPTPLPFGFQFSGSCWVEGVFFLCVYMLAAFNLLLELLCFCCVGFCFCRAAFITFVANFGVPFIHSFIEGRVSLFMKHGIQCLCPSSLSFSPRTTTHLQMSFDECSIGQKTTIIA
jgi:hypothetical protein